mgnify:CR=1 FL=1
MLAEPTRILDADGSPVSEVEHELDTVRYLYRSMVTARIFDRKASALQRQGRLATYAPFEGQEASQIGTAASLKEEDWLVASYRDAAAMNLHGYPWELLLAGRMGDERGGHTPEGINVLPPSITVGGHMIHAAGIAWAQKIKKNNAIAVTIFGDGATSEGDFHEAMNFAGVFELPMIFVCQNNGWAISTPRERQTASETIAQKAHAYGFTGVLVDGNDVLAVDQVIRHSIDRARQGKGPTLVEALTYRIRGHTTADDHSRYREKTHIESWRRNDPLNRVQKFLKAHDAWSAQWQSEIEQSASSQIEHAVTRAENLAPFDVGEIFSGSFAELTPTLLEQRQEAEGYDS